MLRNEGGRAISVRHVLNQKKTSKVFFVPFFTTMEVVAPLENDPILSGRLIRSFRHLELQNPSIISYFRQIQDGATIQEEEQDEEQEEEQGEEQEEEQEEELYT